MGDTRNCEQCGISFAPRREHARFCSARCRVAWNREHTFDPTVEVNALEWSLTALRDTADRLPRVRAWDRPRAFAVIGEAVWWVTIVDGTLVRHHPEAYDEVMGCLAARPRRLVEGTLGGLRYVRNRMGHDVDHVDFIDPRVAPHGPDASSREDRITDWTWKMAPEPTLAALPPRGQAWELTRYRSYQAHLAGHTIGDIFGRAVDFLKLAAGKATAEVGAQPTRRLRLPGNHGSSLAVHLSEYSVKLSGKKAVKDVGGRVEGKVALVTGAARGQGRAHAVRLAAEGADVIVVDVCAPLPSVPYDSATPEDLAETVRLAEKTGRRVISGIVDVRDLEALRRIVDDAVGQLGQLDVVVANAGICVPKPWDATTPKIFDDTISTNITGVWNTVMVSAPHLVNAGGRSIILISSAAGLKVQPFMVPYTTSKFAVRGMAKAFAAELGKHHIRVNSVHPTAVNTPMGSGNMQAEIGAAIAGYDRLGGMFTNMLPVDSTEPEDIADSVLFLASDESKFITAHEIAPDAGVTEF